MTIEFQFLIGKIARLIFRQEDLIWIGFQFLIGKIAHFQHFWSLFSSC